MEHNRAPSTVVLQTAHNGHVSFDVGRAALQVTSAIQAAPLWKADLWLVAAPSVTAAAVATALGAYAVAIDNPGAWPVPAAQPVMFVLVASWLLAAWRLSARMLEAVMYGTICWFIMMLALLFWWIASFDTIKHASPVLWGILTAALTMEALCVIGASMALTNLLDCRLICDAHACTHAAFVKRTEAHLRRGDLGNGQDEMRMTAAALALHDAAMSGKPSTKKNE